MAETVNDPRAPGWKHDPSGRFSGRYWDGTKWTEHVVDQDRVTSTDPLPSGQAPPSRPDTPVRSRAQPGRRLPRWAKVALPLAVVVAVVLVATAGGDDDSFDGTASPGTEDVHALGETARTDAFDVTVYGFKDPQAPGQFLKPAAGNHFVSVDVQVANPGRSQRSFSSLLGFHLVDAANRQFDLSISEVTPRPPDGEIPSGQAIRGTAVFEVPDGATGLRFRVQGSLTAAGALFELR